MRKLERNVKKRVTTHDMGPFWALRSGGFSASDKNNWDELLSDKCLWI